MGGVLCAPPSKTLAFSSLCGGDPLGPMTHVTSSGSATGPALRLPKGALASSICPGTSSSSSMKRAESLKTCRKSAEKQQWTAADGQQLSTESAVRSGLHWAEYISHPVLTLQKQETHRYEHGPGASWSPVNGDKRLLGEGDTLFEKMV